MTAEQLDVARGVLDSQMENFFGTVDKPNVSFHQGFIEDLSFIETSSVDVVGMISHKKPLITIFGSAASIKSTKNFNSLRFWFIFGIKLH